MFLQNKSLIYVVPMFVQATCLFMFWCCQ